MKKFSILTVGVDVINIDVAIEKAKQLNALLQHNDTLSVRILRDLGKAEELSKYNAKSNDKKNYWVVNREEWIRANSIRCKDPKEPGRQFYELSKGMNFILTDGVAIYSVNYFNNMFA